MSRLALWNAFDRPRTAATCSAFAVMSCVANAGSGTSSAGLAMAVCSVSVKSIARNTLGTTVG